MKITRSATLPAGVEDVFAIIETEEYQLAKVRAQAPEASATVTEQDGGATLVRTVRQVPTQGMPSAVVSMIGDTLTVTEQQTWRPALADGSRHADLAIDVSGAPITLTGQISLAPSGRGCELSVVADLSCAIPLLGRKIEQAARPVIEESIEQEIRQLTERLS